MRTRGRHSINPLLAPLSSLLYRSLRDDIYCIIWIVGPDSTMSAGCEYFHHLITSMGIPTIMIASPVGGWIHNNIFASKKKIADKRDEQPHIIILTISLDECHAIDMLDIGADMIVFDPGYTAIQSNSDYARAISKALNHFLSLERKQKICLYPKESHTLHDLIAEGGFDLALSYSSSIMASFWLETQQPGHYTVTIMGQSLPFSLHKPIPQTLIPAYTVACASLYALLQEKDTIIDVMQTYHMMDCLHLETANYDTQQRFFGARETINSVGGSSTNRIIIAPHKHDTQQTTITYHDYDTKKITDSINDPQRGKTYFPFFGQPTALRFAKAIFPGYLCLCESKTAQETQHIMTIIGHS